MNENALSDALKALSEKLHADIIIYQDDISSEGAQKIFEITSTSNPKNKNVFFILRTQGGCPHAAFKVARRLQDQYKIFYLYVDSFCKSAGTLIAIGSDEIIMSDYAEFGPLDVQLQEKDEVNRFSSGLNINEAMLNIRQDSIKFFIDLLLQLTNVGLTTKTAAEVASNLSINFFSPILSQINPIRIGETSRAVKIALAYGERLIKDRGNLLSYKELVTLVQRYPDHHFVIDFKEASSIFKNIRKESETEQLIKKLMTTDKKIVEVLYKKEDYHESNNQQADTVGAAKGEKSARNLNEENSRGVPKTSSSRKSAVPI